MLSEHIDPFISVQGSWEVLNFGRVRGIDISGCKDLGTLFAAAVQLREYLESHKPTAKFPDLPERYLLLHFCGLAIHHSRLSIDSSEAERFIDQAWGGFDWQSGRWNS